MINLDIQSVAKYWDPACAPQSNIPTSKKLEIPVGSWRELIIMADLNLNELDYDKLVQDAIFYILTQEQKRPIFYKGAVMKAIDYTSKPKESQDKIWNRTMRELEDVFGYFLSRVGTDGNGN